MLKPKEILKKERETKRMIIKTKYDIGDIVEYDCGYRNCVGVIQGADCKVLDCGVIIAYTICDMRYINSADNAVIDKIDQHKIIRKFNKSKFKKIYEAEKAKEIAQFQRELAEKAMEGKSYEFMDIKSK